MQPSASLLKNNSLAAQAGAPQAVSGAIHKASQRTGVDFAYLMNQAKAESSYNPAAKAKTSSASGLFQFIERTWLDMVNRHGEKYGLDAYAEKIDANLRVSDRGTKQQILALRNDPQMASYMAAEFAAENKATLERRVGGDIGATEMYLAHFLGAAGASGFLSELRHNPMTIAADIMPAAASANRNVFFDPQTRNPRTLQQVYDLFDRKFEAPITQPPVMQAAPEQRQPVIAETTAPAERVKTAGYRPVPQQRNVAYEREAQASSLASLLSEDQVPRSLKLSDYRNNAGQIPALRTVVPAQATPMSIADLLTLSSVDL